MKQTSLVIPAECEAVTGIRENDTLVSVSFASPDTVVRSGAFKDCTKLKNVELPANLTEIQSHTFSGCIRLETLVVPDAVSVIEYDAFYSCTGLKIIVLPEGLTEIDNFAFRYCSALESITVPATVKSIGSNAFQGCESLKELNLNVGLESIGDSAFENCNSLTTIRIPEGVKSLGDRALADCASLEALYLPASLEDVSKTAISQIHNITVYVVESSYMDQRLTYNEENPLANMLGIDFFDKQYYGTAIPTAPSDTATTDPSDEPTTIPTTPATSEPTAAPTDGPTTAPTTNSTYPDSSDLFHPLMIEDIILSVDDNSTSILGKTSKRIFADLNLAYAEQSLYDETDYPSGIPYTLSYRGENGENETCIQLEDLFINDSAEVALHSIVVNFGVDGCPDISLLGFSNNTSKQTMHDLMGMWDKEALTRVDRHSHYYTYYWHYLRVGDTKIEYISADVVNDTVVTLSIYFSH